MAEHPPVLTLLAQSTLKLIGAHDPRADQPDEASWLIARPAWALHVGDYVLAIARRPDGPCVVVIGHENYAGAVHVGAERHGVSDLDVDAVVLDLWHQGSGQPVEVRHADR